MIADFALTALVVKDYVETIQFYCGKLGFVIADDKDMGQGKRWLTLRAPGGKGSGIHVAKAENEQQLAAVGNQVGGRVLFFFHTDDFEADHARFKSLGVEFEEKPRYEPYGIVAVFKDLYGNRIDLIQPR